MHLTVKKKEKKKVNILVFFPLFLDTIVNARWQLHYTVVRQSSQLPHVRARFWF